MKNSAKGYIYLVLTFVIWGSLYVVSKYAMETVPPFTVLLSRYLISVLIFGAITAKKGFKPIKRGHIKYFVIVGAVGYFAGIGLQLAGTSMIDASLASLVNATNPIVISIMAAALLKESFGIKKVSGIVLSIIGVYIILGTGSGKINAMGIIVSILSVIFWSAACVIIRKISDEYDPVTIALYGMIMALVLTVPVCVYEIKTMPCAFTPSAIIAMLYMAVVCTAAAHACWNNALSLIDASTCSMFYPLQPLTSAVLGILLLGETLTVNFVIGAVIISAGILIAVIKRKE